MTGFEPSAQSTREKILVAAVDCLIDYGVASTSTLAVQQRARVSRGALLHHFPTRATLLAASVTELVRRNEQAVAQALSKLDQGAPGPDGLQPAFAALAFSARQQSFRAEMEMWATARTDLELRAMLQKAERAARQDFERVFDGLFGAQLSSGDKADIVLLTRHVMRGLAISENLTAGDTQADQLVAAWTRAVSKIIGNTPQTKQGAG